LLIERLTRQIHIIHYLLLLSFIISDIFECNPNGSSMFAILGTFCKKLSSLFWLSFAVNRYTVPVLINFSKTVCSAFVSSILIKLIDVNLTFNQPLRMITLSFVITYLTNLNLNCSIAT